MPMLDRWTGRFSGPAKTEILFHYNGDHRWWLGTVSNNGLTLTGVDPFWQDVARGALLIGAVSFDRLRERIGA